MNLNLIIGFLPPMHSPRANGDEPYQDASILDHLPQTPRQRGRTSVMISGLGIHTADPAGAGKKTGTGQSSGLAGARRQEDEEYHARRADPRGRG